MSEQEKRQSEMETPNRTPAVEAEQNPVLDAADAETDPDMVWDAEETAGAPGAAAMPRQEQKQEYGLGLTAMILGILSILAFCIPIVGLVLGAVAIVLGIVAAAKGKGKKMGTAGLIMGGISLLTYLLILLIFGGVFQMANRNRDYFTETAWRKTEDGSTLYLYADGSFIAAEQEGGLQDNFYSGTYDVVAYSETNFDFTELEESHQTEGMYDVILHVELYVVQGEEQTAIADNIHYLYMLALPYEPGDLAEVCAHNGKTYSAVYLMKETQMCYPTDGNRYAGGTSEETTTDPEADGAEVTTVEPETDDADTTTGSETDGAEMTTGSEGNDTETTAATEIDDTEATTAAPEADSTEATTAAPEANDTEANATEKPIWDFWQDSSEELNDIASSASEELDDISSSASEQLEEISSSASEELEQSDVDPDGIRSFFQRLLQRIEQWIRKWSL